MSKKKKPAGKATLLGMGLDNDDGHKRITTGDQFALVGGSAETHERMTETALKTFEVLKKRGKRLEQVEPVELAEILDQAKPK